VTRMWAMPYEGFQSFFNVLTQISPEPETFGWNIFVANQPVQRCQRLATPCARGNVHFGGAAGNSSVNLNLTRK
jgi:hypothetical protein